MAIREFKVGVGSPAFITDGGTASQFVKGDGTLDLNVYLTDAIISITPGTGLDITAGNTPTLTLDFTEFSIGGTLIATDYLVAVNGGVENRQLISNIPLGIFNNDQNWTPNLGTVTSVGATSPILSSSGGTTPVITHATTTGYKHIPSGGSSGDALLWSADGTAVWGAIGNTNTQYEVVTSDAATTVAVANTNYTFSNSAGDFNFTALASGNGDFTDIFLQDINSFNITNTVTGGEPAYADGMMIRVLNPGLSEIRVFELNADGGAGGTVTSVSSATTNQLTVANGTTTPSLSIVTGAVADLGTALATGDQIYDFVIGLGYTSNTGTVTSVSAGNGMNFTTITGSGTVTLGTPSAVTGTSTNSVTATSHTHSVTTGAVVNGGTNLVDANDVYDFVIGLGYSTQTLTASEGVNLVSSDIQMNILNLTSATATTNVAADSMVYYDLSLGRHVKQTFSEVHLSAFDNDLGWTSNAGDITNVSAGNGLTGGGASGSVTVTLGTPTAVTGTSTNSTTTTSHTHAVTTGAVVNGGTNLVDANDVYDFVIGLGYTSNIGDITGVNITAGTGLTGSQNTTSGQHTQTLALDYLGVDNYIVAGTINNGGLDGGDYIAFSDSSVLSGTVSYSQVNAIDLAQFNNSVGWNNYSHPNHTGQVTSTGDGATALTVSAITAQTALTTGLAGTDELLINDNNVLKRMDVSVMNAYFNANLNFGSGDGIVESLTTTGTSGAATLIAGVLNIPNYATGSTPNDATITLSAGTGLTTGGAFTTDQAANETITFNVGQSNGINVESNAVGVEYGFKTPANNVIQAATVVNGASPAVPDSADTILYNRDSSGFVYERAFSTIPLSIFDNTASGFISGNQTITLSGDVTGSGTTSITTAIASGVVGATELNVTGNGTTAQYLRSDGDGSFTWATPPNDDNYLSGLSYTASTSILTATLTGGLGSVSVDLSNSIRADALAVTGNGTTAQYLRSDGDGTFTWATPTDTTANETITLSGQVSGSGTNAITTALTNTAISAQTALTSGLAGTDELLVSDNGVLKKMDVSVMNAYFNANLSFGTGTMSSWIIKDGDTTTTTVTNGETLTIADNHFIVSNLTSTTSGGTITLSVDYATTNAWTRSQFFSATTANGTGGTWTWNCDRDQVQVLTLTGNIGTFSAPDTGTQNAGGIYTLIIKQSGASTFSISSWASVYKWPGGVAPTITTGAGAVDIITFISDGTNMYGTVAQDFS